MLCQNKMDGLEKFPAGSQSPGALNRGSWTRLISFILHRNGRALGHSMVSNIEMGENNIEMGENISILLCCSEASLMRLCSLSWSRDVLGQVIRYHKDDSGFIYAAIISNVEWMFLMMECFAQGYYPASRILLPVILFLVLN